MRPAAVQITSGGGGGRGVGVGRRRTEVSCVSPDSALFYSAVLPKSGSGRLGRRGGWLRDDQRGRDRQTDRP